MTGPTALLLCLTLLGMLAQIVPFKQFPYPDANAVASVWLPSAYPSGYTATDYAKAHALDSSMFWGGLIEMATGLLALLTLLRSGLGNRVEGISTSKARLWLGRVAFLAAVFLALRVVDFPFRFYRFQQYRAFGLSILTTPTWIKLVLLGMVVPLTLFILKYILVTCTLPLCKKYWWLASAVSLFVISDVVPELISRTYPIDPVENLKPLESGPHYSAMKATLHKAGLDLPIMVVNESKRSKSANICLTGRSGREYVLATDTFINQYTPEQVALAMAHEMGHLQHKAYSTVIDKSFSLMLLLLSFGLAFWLSGRKALPVRAAPRTVILCMLCASLLSAAFAPVSLALSRDEERFADHYALRLGDDSGQFAELLKRVARNEMQPLDLPAWQYYLSASHPTFLERIAEAQKR